MMWLALAVTVAALALGQGTPGESERPVLSFGVVADIQYADKPAAGRRATLYLSEYLLPLNVAME